ncbi:hypothetical protein EX530_06605 [Xanthomonas phaseoli]|uniref:hypothetical protein n=1 Tax=Xanthomonas phaseoli TaxID=1985254 RepID=UPI003B001CA1
MAQQRFQKSTSFPLFFLCRVLAWLPGRLDDAVAKPMPRHYLPPVRQLKIFYPTAALPASYEQKCANLSSVSSVMHAPARTDYRIHRVHRWMTERGGMAQIFFTGRTPNPHERLTSEIRRSAGGRAVDARWIVAADPPHRHATNGIAVGGGRRVPLADCAPARAASLHRGPHHRRSRAKKWPLQERPSDTGGNDT